jgi:hypothetical protein
MESTGHGCCTGYASFGVGVEIAGITFPKYVKWFKGRTCPCHGVEMATARLGTALALSTYAPIALIL